MTENIKSKQLLCLLALTCLVTLFSFSCGGLSQGDAAEKKNTDQEDKGVPVRVVSLTRGEISEFLTETSTIEAERRVDIYPRVTGEITEIIAEEGNEIGIGKPLCKLEDKELKLAEEKAKKDMEEAERILNRAKKEFENKVIAENDLIQAQHRYDLALIDWKQKKANLDYSEIVSPIKSVVSERFVRLGQKVDPSVKLYSLFDPKSLVVNIHISESDYFNKVAGREKSIKAIVGSKSLPGKEFTGKIKRVAPIVDSDTNTIKVTVSYNDPGGELLPGMFVNVMLVTDVHEQAILVPNDAIVYDNELQYVFVARGEEAERILLKAGFRNEKFVEATEDLKEGDEIIVIGQTGLKDGSKIRIVRDSEEEVEE